VSDGVSSDAGSAAERGRRRVWRLNLTVIASLGFRGAMWLSTLIYIPLTVRYLGPGRFGLWVAMTSVIALFGVRRLWHWLWPDQSRGASRWTRGGRYRPAIDQQHVLCAVGSGAVGLPLVRSRYPFYSLAIRISHQRPA